MQDGDARRSRPRLRCRADALQSALGAGRGNAWHSGRRAARDRPRADRGAAAPRDLQPRSHGRFHHVCRHLLRRHVWRLDHLDPAQHAGRIGYDRDRARGQSHGAPGPRRPCARDRRDRLVRRRHHRYPGADLRRPPHGATRAPLQSRRLFRSDGPGLHHDHGGARQLAVAWSGEPVSRPGAWPRRHRHAVRPGALHAWHPGAAGWHRRDRGGGRPVRRGRDALRRQPLPVRAGGDHSGQRARSG